MVSVPRCGAVIPGAVASVVEATEEVEALGVDVEVEDHHDEEVEQAEQQDTFTDALQSPAQHQPGHGRGRWPSGDGQPRQRRRGYTHAIILTAMLLITAAARSRIKTCAWLSHYLTSAGVIGSKMSSGRPHRWLQLKSHLPTHSWCRIPA